MSEVFCDVLILTTRQTCEVVWNQNSELFEYFIEIIQCIGLRFCSSKRAFGVQMLVKFFKFFCYLSCLAIPDKQWILYQLHIEESGLP